VKGVKFAVALASAVIVFMDEVEGINRKIIAESGARDDHLS
jgi:hypothetical protein